MKKIIIVFLLLIPIKVNGKVIYSDYYLYKENESVFYEENDLLKREEKTLYNNYLLVREDIGYLSLNNNDYLVDEDDYIEKEVYLDSYEEGATGPHTSFINTYNKDFQYIIMNNFKEGDIKFNKMFFYLSGERIHFTIHNTNFLFRDNVGNNSQMILNFNRLLPMDELVIDFHFTIMHSDEITFDFYLTDDLNSDYTLFENKVIRHDETEIYSVNFKGYEKKHYFLSKEILYKHYLMNKEITNQYTKEPLSNYLHDLNDKKIVYDYYKRDKIIINEEVNNLNDTIIEYSSSNIAKINNLNLFENGIQNIEICLESGFCFKEEININIQEINNEKITEINNKETKPKEKLENNNKPKEVIKITNKEMRSIPREEIITKELLNMSTKEEKKSNKLLFITLIILILLVIILKLRKGFVESV